MHPTSTIAGGNGCEKLNVKIAFPFGSIPSKKTIANKPMAKIPLTVQNASVDTVIVSVVTSLT